MVRRVLGWIFLALAVGLFGAALFDWVAQGRALTSPLGQVWYDLHRSSLAIFQPVVERYIHPALWWYVIQPVLETPLWIVALVALLIGFVLLQLRRRRHRFGRG